MGKLTVAIRKKLSKSQFANPSKAPGSGSYPIPDAAHARNALARASQHASSELQAKIKSKVRAKYPGIHQGK